MSSPEPLGGARGSQATRSEIPLAALDGRRSLSAALRAAGHRRARLAVARPLVEPARRSAGRGAARTPGASAGHGHGNDRVRARGRDRPRARVGDGRPGRRAGHRLSRGGRHDAARRPRSDSSAPAWTRRAATSACASRAARFLAAAFAASAGAAGPSVAARGGRPRSTRSSRRRSSRTRAPGPTRSRWRACGRLWSRRASSPATISGGSSARCGSSAGRSRSTPGRPSARPAPTAEAARFEGLRVPAPGRGSFRGHGGGLRLPSGGGAPTRRQPAAAAPGLVFCGRASLSSATSSGGGSGSRILRAGLYALVAYFPINVGVALLGLFDWYVDFRRRGGEGTEKS